ncbi:MAG: hypothetical protein ACYS5F_15505 [Planctomycetota bacterium]|jgi:hypothetical protein
MSNEAERLDEVVDALEQEGINAKDSIKDINIGNKVAKVLNTFGVTPQRVQSWLGIEECGCKKRQKFLNGVLSFMKPPKAD